MYYILKFSENWSLYNDSTNESRLLDRAEIESLKKLFPTLLSESGKLLSAIRVTSIQPNKLINITQTSKSEKSKKSIEQPLKGGIT